MNETVRMPKFVLWLAIAVSLTVTLAYVGAVLVSGPPPAFERPSQIEMVALSMMFVLFGLLLPGYLIAAYLRDALFLAGTTLTVRGLFGEQSIDLSRLTRITWLTYGMGTIVLTADDRRLTLSYLDFWPAAKYRLALIRRLRECVPPEQQQGWDEFCCERTMPLVAKVTDQRELRAASPELKQMELRLILFTIFWGAMTLIWLHWREVTSVWYFFMGTWLLVGLPSLLFLLYRLLSVAKQVQKSATLRALAEWEAYLSKATREGAV